MIEKQFYLTIDGKHDVDCIVSVPYGNCIRLEYRDESKQLLETGYKCYHLGILGYPIEFMQTVELHVIKMIEITINRKVTDIRSDSMQYTQDDLKLADQWRKFLQGDSDELTPKFEQLSLF